MIYETHTRFIKAFKDLIHFIRALNLGKHFLKVLWREYFISGAFCTYLRAVTFGQMEQILHSLFLNCTEPF